MRQQVMTIVMLPTVFYQLKMASALKSEQNQSNRFRPKPGLETVWR